MVREVKTLWFREKSVLDDPLITLPFVGDVSPRKLIYAVIFAIPSFTIASLLGLNPLIAILAGGIAGFLVAREPKAISIEKQLLYMLTGSYRPSMKAIAREPRVRYAKEEIVHLALIELEPVKIHGILVDPYGNPIAGAELELWIDSQRVSKTISDSSGRYTFYVYLKPGQHSVEVRLGGNIVLRKKVIVSVKRPART